MAGSAKRSVTCAVLVSLVFAPAAGPAAEPSSILASYSFEDAVATGPDTFAIWQGARHTGTGQGRVTLSEAFHLSGYRSVEIKDVAGDGDFPEVQGYFPVRSEGRLFFHFAFLTTDANEELNIALAGPRFFKVEKDGIAFWLGTRDGRLVHVSDGATKSLFAVEAFVWYGVDVAYDVAAGTYALTVRREGVDAPLVALRDQSNPARLPRSALDKFSFVGSPYVDRSNVVYDIDDVVIGTDESVAEVPFVAPGRRKLFVDLFGEYQRQLRERPRCLPVTRPEDLGLTPSDLTGVGREALALMARTLLGGESLDPARAKELTAPWQRVFAPANEWKAGCDALEASERRPPRRKRGCSPSRRSSRWRPSNASAKRTTSSSALQTIATIHGMRSFPRTSDSRGATSARRKGGCATRRRGSSTARPTRCWRSSRRLFPTTSWRPFAAAWARSSTTAWKRH
jgi:hypothetical protein